MKVGDCMNVWRSTETMIQWTDLDGWYDRDFIDDVASSVHREFDSIRRVAVIRIKYIKEKQA